MSRHLAPVPDRPGRVLLYVRVSALMGRGGDDFHSPEVQVNAMRRATAGMREVGVIDDDIDVSGRSFTRDGIERIREMVEAGQVDVLAVYNLARFGRNTMEGLRFLNWLADRGVTILSASEHVDTSTPSGRWMLTTLLGLAEMRSDEIGIEWGNTIRHRALAGKHHGRVPTGYLKGEDGRLVPDPALGPVVAQAFRDYADEDVVREIRRRLQAATGLTVAGSTFKAMLGNHAYRGAVRLGARGPAGAVEVEGAHPPLVDEATWERVQARMARDRWMPPRLASPKYSLSGLARCGACTGRVNHHPERAKVKMYCVAHRELHGACTGCGSPNVLDVEAAVLERIKGHIAKLRGDVGAQAAQLSKTFRAGADVDALRGELAATRRAMARLTERWVREQIDDRTYQDTMSGLRSSEERLAVALGGAQRIAETPEPGKVVGLAEKLVELWPRMDGGQRNRALRDLIEVVIIKPSQRYRQPASERVEVVWR